MGAFEFHVGGLEDAILDLLKEKLVGVVKTFALYSGELDSANVKTALGALTPKFPLILVSYAEGDDQPDPPTGIIKGAPLHFRHECSFAVICATNDARSETSRRRGPVTPANEWPGVYQLIDGVREALGGIQFASVNDATGETILLNDRPFIPLGVEFVARLPNITAYAAIFDTNFRYTTPDRRAVAGPSVSRLNLDVTAQHGGLLAANLPGVNRLR